MPVKGTLKPQLKPVVPDKGMPDESAAATHALRGDVPAIQKRAEPDMLRYRALFRFGPLSAKAVS